MSQTCIIAEHDPWDIRLLRIYAERAGYRLQQAFDGADVLRLARAERPDVIVLDAELPGSPRVGDVLRALDADRLTRNIPIVLFSWFDEGMGSVPDVDPIIRLQKPATYEAFVAAMNDAGLDRKLAASSPG
jgi:CheY-like chemotaxis protein